MLCMYHVMTRLRSSFDPDLVKFVNAAANTARSSVTKAAKGFKLGAGSNSGSNTVQSAVAGEPADIVSGPIAQHDNRRHAGDRPFGAASATARAVVDAVIVAYERMIGSFNYASPARRTA